MAKQEGKSPTIRVRKREQGHLANLGLSADKSLFQTPVEYRSSFGDDFDVDMSDDLLQYHLAAAKLALDGNIVLLYNTLDSKHKRKMLSYLNNQNLNLRGK